MDKPIVLLISAKAQHGKDSFADAFMKEAGDKLGFRCLRIKYGDILKYVCKEYFGWDGNKDEVGRQILQQVGTNLCRNNNPEVWVNCVKEIVKGLKTEFDYVLVPDTRFPNEIEAWEDTEFFTFTIRLNRKNEDGTDFDNGLTPEQKMHPSETELDNYSFNYIIENKSLEDVEFAAKEILEDLIRLDKEGHIGG